MKRNSQFSRPFVVLLVALAVGSGWWSGSNRAETQSPRLKGNVEIDGLQAAASIERALMKAIARSEASVVAIARVKRVKDQPRQPGNQFFPPANRDRDDPSSPDFTPNAFGSGIIIAPLKGSSQRFILTNYHVVKGGPAAGREKAPLSEYRLYVRLAKLGGYYAKIIAADPRSDLAVLSIDTEALRIKPSDLTPLRMSPADTYRKGQLVLALGNPYAVARDGSASVSWGMISNTSRRPRPAGRKDDSEIQKQKKETIHHYGTLLQVDTRLNLGTSGGALINLKGELIGITTSLAALEGYESSVGYAIPFDAATRRIVESLARGHEVEYGFLGISPEDISSQRLRRLPPRFALRSAAMAVTVHRNAPAGRGGMRPGDIILSVNEMPIRNKYELMGRIGRLPPGDLARIRVWRERDRKELRLKVRLGKWPVVNEDEIIATKPRFPAWRGLQVDYPTGRNKYLQEPYQYHAAVLLTGLTKPKLVGNPNFSPGVFISHVNGTPVSTPGDFFAAARNLKGTVTLTLIDGKRISIPE